MPTNIRPFIAGSRTHGEGEARRYQALRMSPLLAFASRQLKDGQRSYAGSDRAGSTDVDAVNPRQP